VASREDPLSLHLDEHHLRSGLLTFTSHTLSILIDLGAIESFVFCETLKIIKVKELEWDEFSSIELDLGSK
jgi:hypothetical protein